MDVFLYACEVALCGGHGSVADVGKTLADQKEDAKDGLWTRTFHLQKNR